LAAADFPVEFADDNKKREKQMPNACSRLRKFSQQVASDFEIEFSKTGNTVKTKIRINWHFFSIFQSSNNGGGGGGGG